ncbi:MAG: RNA polymerase sigma factor [Bacteroidia bacterium]
MSQNVTQDLIEKCIQGNSNAHKKLYELTSKQMYGICLRYCKDAEDAKDTLQEGYIRVFGKMKQFEGKGVIQAWMRRIFVNCALENIRVNKFYTETSDIAEEFDLGFDSFTIDRISQKEIMETMQKLALGYRTVLNLYAIEGFSHAEIAEMLGINEGTSKSQLARARAAFIKEYKKVN